MRTSITAVLGILLAIPFLASSATCVDITRSLTLNSKGADVSQLQQFLKDNAEYSGSVSGNVGQGTLVALKKWQASKGIVSSGTPETTGYGVTGPRTRAMMSCVKQSPTTSSAGGPALASVERATLIRALLVRVEELRAMMRAIDAKTASAIATSSTTSAPAPVSTVSQAMASPPAPSSVTVAVPSCTLATYGAKGDGMTDDTVAIRRALSAGCAVSGENRTYRVTSTIELPDNTNLRDGTFLQDIPAHSLLRLFYKASGKNVTMTNIRINRGANPKLGTISDAGAIWIGNTNNVTLTDVEIYGDGHGTAILLAYSKDIKLIRPYIHDMRWASDIQPETEVLVGIRFVETENVLLESLRMKNLTPTSAVFTTDVGFRKAGERTVMTDGVNPGGLNFTMNNADISNVGEGVDISGNSNNRNFLLTNNNIYDVDAYCYKVTNLQGPGVLRDNIGANCGYSAYVLSGPVTDVQLIGNKAINTGSSGIWKASRVAGFSLDYSYGAMPSKITLKDNQAIDTQNIHTMRYGFESEQTIPTHTFINNIAQGYQIAPASGFATQVGPDGSCIIDGVSVQNNGSISAYQQSSVPAGSVCAPETRRCTNGSLSGSYPRVACIVEPAQNSCSFNGSTIAHGSSVTAYQQGSLPAGYSCATLSEIRTCSNGVLSGSYAQSSCTVDCMLGGTTVLHGASVTAYQQGSVPTGHVCVSQSRTCTNGTLSGTYPRASCVVGLSMPQDYASLASALAGLRRALEALTAIF